MQDVENLFCRYKDDVYRLALSYTRNTQEAEDACQTVFLKLMEQKDIVPGKERAWLMQVTANTCRNLLRSSWWKKTVELDETVAAPERADTGVYQAVMGLTPKYRVVVYLYYYECCSTREIADILKISQNTVTTRLGRARAMLRQQLKEVSL